jgi:hypothetical protein
MPNAAAPPAPPAPTTGPHPQAPIATAQALALAPVAIAPQDVIETFKQCGNGERGAPSNGIGVCSAACCKIAPQLHWLPTVFGNTYAQYNVGGNWVQLSFAAKLGEFHDKLGTNPSAGQYGKVLNKQREFIRAWGFPAPSSAKANGTHAAISGATITYHRLQYNEFRDFDTQHLNAARAGLFGYPAIHPKVFPRENRVSCASSPLFLHTLNPSSFLAELKLAILMKAGAASSETFYETKMPLFKKGKYIGKEAQPFAHHSPSAVANPNCARAARTNRN